MLVEEILNMLQTYGLTRAQAQIFVYLIRAGASGVGDISKALKVNRMKIYRNLKRMENMGLVSVLPGRPMRFSAVPANIALNTLLSAAKRKVSEMESRYAMILDALSKISSQQREYFVETRFRIHSGRRNVYAIMTQMLENCEREVCLLTTPNDLICLSLYGFDDSMRKLKARGVKVNIVTNIMDEKIAMMITDRLKYTVIKHSDIQFKTRLLIVDDKAVFTSLAVDDSISLGSESDSGFWTDSPHYTHSAKIFFDMVWRNAQDISAVLQYLKTGRRIEKIVTFNEIDEYHRYFTEIVSRAEGEVLICIKKIREPYLMKDFIQVLEKARARGVKIKLITYLDEDSYTFGEKSSILNVAEVRHVDIEYTGVDFMATDTGESLLCCFPSDFLGESNTQIQGLWSNSISFAHILRAVFMELWFKTISSAERLMEIQFRRAVKEMPETLGSIAGEKGLLLEMPVVIKGMSGLKHRFDLALRKRGSEGELVVGDALPEKGDVKEALISLYLKAMDVKAHQKLFIVSREEKLSAEERELAATYSIKLIDGLEPAELSRKIMERIL